MHLIMSPSSFTDSIQSTVLKPEGRQKSSISSSEQKARKRASDREAQRRIRARTKDYIVHLERELAQLKNNQWRDRTIQELLQRNEATEKELIELRKTLRLLEDGSTHCQPSPFTSQIGTDAFPTPASDTTDIVTSRAGACSGSHTSQILINGSFFPGHDDAHHLATNIWGGGDDASLFSLVHGPSPAHDFTGHTPSSSYHSMVTPGSATAHLFNGIYFHHRVGNGFSVNGSADIVPKVPCLLETQPRDSLRSFS